MVIRVIALSGQIAAGKTSLAVSLEQKHQCRRVTTSDLIQQLKPELGQDRTALQRAGEALDRETQGQWVADGVAEIVRLDQSSRVILLDSARTKEQIEHIRRAIGHRFVRHVHLEADVELRRERHSERGRMIDGNTPFELASQNQTEQAAASLAETADIVLNTQHYPIESATTFVAARFGLLSSTAEPLVDVVVGGQYGSEGKGNVANYLAPEYDILMRVGGPNAGHKVYEEPEPYTHISLPCGTRGKGDQLLLIGPGAVLNPQLLLKEIADCEVSADRLVIDERAVLITDEDIAWEKVELAGIASTANGVGRATARRVMHRVLGADKPKLAQDEPLLRGFVGCTAERLERAFAGGHKVLVEGTQGTSLSLFHGPRYPYLTSRDTTVAGCISEAGISPRRVRRVVMVCRTYPIRVGGPSGDLPGEISWEIVARRSGLAEPKLRSHEVGSRSGNLRRVGEFDWAQLRRSVHLNSPTDIALTFVDYLDVLNSSAVRFDQLTAKTIQFINDVEAVSGVPCSLLTTRFDERCIIDRRSWR